MPHVLSWRTEYNVWRVAAIGAPVRWHQSLAEVAQWKAEDMRDRGYFDHRTPEGWMPWDLVRMAGITPPGFVAECIGGGYVEAPPLLAAYADSPSHLQVLEDDRFTHHGTGRAPGRTVYWSMLWLGGLE
jgi:uncharacterized protein YkwD